MKPNLQQSALKIFPFQFCTAQMMRLPHSSKAPSFNYPPTFLEKGHLKKIWSLFSVHALHSTHKMSQLITQLTFLSLADNLSLKANQGMKACLGMGLANQTISHQLIVGLLGLIWSQALDIEKVTRSSNLAYLQFQALFRITVTREFSI